MRASFFEPWQLSVTIVVAIAVAVAIHDVLHANIVAPAERLPILMPVPAPHARMPVLIAIIHVGLTMIFKIPPRAFDAIMKPSPPDIAAVRI
jgi:hypothetical protein